MDNFPLEHKRIIAFVGMPGAGKSIAASYLKSKNYAIVRFGDITDEQLKQLQLPDTPKNEEIIRESLRKEYGMAIYAIKSAPIIHDLLAQHQIVVIDGLYSWEEYLYLKKEFPFLLVVHVFAQPQKRYARLSVRAVRSFTLNETLLREVSEIEHLNKGGPIAIADYMIDNDGNITDLYMKIDQLLKVTL